MKDKLERIRSTFGKVFPQPLFYNFDNALRFELSPGGDWPTRILYGWDRARTILDALPATDNDWDVIIACYGEVVEDLTARFNKGCLTSYGCDESQLSTVGQVFVEDEMGRTFFSLSPPPSIDACLFANLASDNSHLVLPFPGKIYLIDWTNEIIVWPYDDRGMDVVANDKEALRPLYESFGDWLLDYDRERIDKLFAH